MRAFKSKWKVKIQKYPIKGRFYRFATNKNIKRRTLYYEKPNITTEI